MLFKRNDVSVPRFVVTIDLISGRKYNGKAKLCQ